MGPSELGAPPVTVATRATNEDGGGVSTPITGRVTANSGNVPITQDKFQAPSAPLTAFGVSFAMASDSVTKPPTTRECNGRLASTHQSCENDEANSMEERERFLSSTMPVKLCQQIVQNSGTGNVRTSEVTKNSKKQVRMADTASAMSKLHGLFQRNNGAAQLLPSEAATHRTKSRGYAALATETLRALCRSRGLPCIGDRAKLLTSLATSPLQAEQHSDKIGCPQQQSSGVAAKRSAGQGFKGTCGPVVKKTHAVTKLLQDAARLAREVEDVQRQFNKSKRQLLVDGANATALLDDIAAAGAACKSGQDAITLA